MQHGDLEGAESVDSTSDVDDDLDLSQVSECFSIFDG
jgi:hypothetical protein